MGNVVRKNGFYWCNLDGWWITCEWHNTDGGWFIPGYSEMFHDDKFAQIDERRIEREQ